MTTPPVVLLLLGSILLLVIISGSCGSSSSSRGITTSNSSSVLLDTDDDADAESQGKTDTIPSGNEECTSLLPTTTNINNNNSAGGNGTTTTMDRCQPSSSSETALSSNNNNVQTNVFDHHPQNTNAAGSSSWNVVQVDSDADSAMQLASKMIAGKKNVKVQRVNFSGQSTQAGIFSGGRSVIQLDAGIILSTGRAVDAIMGMGTGNNDPYKTTLVVDENASSAGIPLLPLPSLPTYGYPPLGNLTNQTTFNAAVLTIVFECEDEGELFIDYVFASEEYSQKPFAEYQWDDVMGIFLGDDEAQVVENIATLQGSRVSVNQVNCDGSNPLCSYYYVDPGNPALAEMNGNGFTKVLQATGHVHAGANVITIAVADGYDGTSPSWVFIGEGAMLCPVTSEAPSVGPSKEPSSHPSREPSSSPSREPSRSPSTEPSRSPSSSPSSSPSRRPSALPSRWPSKWPTHEPSHRPVTKKPIMRKPTPKPSSAIIIKKPTPHPQQRKPTTKPISNSIPTSKPIIRQGTTPTPHPSQPRPTPTITTTTTPSPSPPPSPLQTSSRYPTTLPPTASASSSKKPRPTTTPLAKCLLKVQGCPCGGGQSLSIQEAKSVTSSRKCVNTRASRFCILPKDFQERVTYLNTLYMFFRKQCLV